MKTVHMMGIGGSGMAALAGLLKQDGWSVRGSDGPIYPPASDELKKLGVQIFEGYRPENLLPHPDLVIVGNVISKTNPEFQALMETKVPYTSMAQAIAKYFIQERESIVIAGTHGKTTTTSLMAFLLDACGKSPGFFVGGVPANFGSGFRKGEGNYFVSEGDEYDTACFEKTPKFIHYRPKHVVLTSVEFDHADIYRDLAHVEEQFSKLISMIPENGTLMACGDDANVRRLCQGAKVQFYGLSENNDWIAHAVEDTAYGKRFSVSYLGKPMGVFESRLLGEHNLRNTLACIAMLATLGMDLKVVQNQLPAFKGVKRRQEFLGEVNAIKFYDDFAHHPTAIKETVHAFLSIKQKGRLWAIFEPRSNTIRRRVFEKTLPESFMEADQTLLAPVYQKKDALSDQELLKPAEVARSINDMNGHARATESMDEIRDILLSELKSGDTVLFMSNGNFGGLTKTIVETYRKSINPAA